MRQGYCSEYRNPEIANLRAQLADAISAIQHHTPFGSASQIQRLALEAHHDAHELRESLCCYASYEPQLADSTYHAAGLAADVLEWAMDAINHRFCANGHWHAGGLPAYQALLEAAMACRNLRSRRLGLQDPMRRAANDAFEYVDE